MLLVVANCVHPDKREAFRKKMKMKFKGYMLRFIMEFYVPVFISVFLNIRYLKLTEIFDYISLLASVVFCILMIAVPVYFAFVIHKHRADLEDPDIKELHGAIYAGLKTSSTSTVFANHVFMMRRFLMVAVLAFLFLWVYM